VAVTELRDHENSVMGGPPARPLRPWVNDLYIYRETTGRPMRRREVPRPHVVMILDLGPSLRFLDPATRRFRGRYPGGWIAGLHERHVLTETEGRQEGVYVSFTPLGARRLLGVPMAELAHRVVTLDDVLGPAADRLLDRMASIGDPYRCLALLERLLMARLAEAPPVSAAVACAWQRITASRGPFLGRFKTGLAIWMPTREAMSMNVCACTESGDASAIGMPLSPPASSRPPNFAAGLPVLPAPTCVT